MKLFNLVLLLVVVAGSNLQAQDYFIVKSGDTTFCDIIYTTPFKFGYLKSGKVEHVNKNEVLEVYRAEDSSSAEVIESLPQEASVESDIDLSRPVKVKSELVAEQRINFAGEKLHQSRTMFYVGLLCQVIGGTLVGVSQTQINPEARNIMLYSGVGLSSAGGIVSVCAFIPIGRAGIELQKVRLHK